jgi:hypothetical protein
VTLLLAAALAAPAAVFAQDAGGARSAAERFGSALTTGRSSSLRPVLPAQGKVRLSLRRLGPEEGVFASGQVEAVFASFLSSGSVRGFSVVSVDSDGKTAALAVARADVTDRDGRTAPVGFRLSLEPEAGRWILREVRETSE